MNEELQIALDLDMGSPEQPHAIGANALVGILLAKVAGHERELIEDFIAWGKANNRLCVEDHRYVFE